MNKEIKNISGILGIAVPKIIIVYDMGGTQIAAANPNGGAIYLSGKVNNRHDKIFALAHEARHLWQVENYAEFEADRRVEDADEYNMLPEEIDANAFATAYMMAEHRVTPKFHGLSDKVRERIYKEARRFFE